MSNYPSSYELAYIKCILDIGNFHTCDNSDICNSIWYKYKQRYSNIESRKVVLELEELINEENVYGT